MEQRTTKWYQDMDKVAKIRAEIERLKKCSESAKMEWVPAGYNQNAFAEDCRIASFNKLLSFIDSIQEEPNDDWKYSIAEKLGISREEYDKIDYNKDYGKEEPASEDLGEYINELSKRFPEVSFAKLSRIAVRVAKWQEKKDQSTIELAEDHAMLAGMEKMKEEMMEKAVDAVCYVTHYEDETQVAYSVSYPKGEETDKYHDKVKLIIIKEE